MRITQVKLKNFKRFTDLTITDIPATAKLVLLIGANGSGKSSVFDAFHNFAGVNLNSEYYLKSAGGGSVSVTFENGEVAQHEYHPGGGIFDKVPVGTRFIGRSSNRIIPRLSRNSKTEQIPTDQDRPATFIDTDIRFDNDVFAYMQIIDDALRAPFFAGEKRADNSKIFQEFIEPFNASLLNVFGDNPRTTIRIVNYQNATPYDDPRVIFQKGGTRINYDLLSHGEKQVVVLLMNFIVRREQYKDAVIYIDEMDCHLNTALQSNLLKEIVSKWIPESSQLWTASHSLGFIDYARNSNQAAIIDLDNLDFDISHVIQPEEKDNLDVYEIAIPKDIISAVLADKKLVVVENKNSALYNLALGKKSYLFLPANNSREVFLTVKGDKKLTGLRDRDYLRNDEIAAIRKGFPNLKILGYYSFENYLYHPANLTEAVGEGFDQDMYVKEIAEQKNRHFNTIISKIGVARQSYVEFKEGISNDGEVDPFIEAIKSDDLETFYPFFNMKEYFDRSVLSKYQLQTRDLVTTTWFANQIEAVLIA